MYRGAPLRVRPRGVGATSGQAILSGGTSAASLATSILVAAGTIGGPAGAIIGAGIAAAAVAIQAIMNSGCGQTCIVSTQFANQAEAALQQNISAYFALPAPRTRANQQAALANFDTFWAWLGAPQQCGNPALGDPGRRCITDRQAGACVWHQTTTPPWGSPVQGACWNWVNGYRDPIANDPNVIDTPVADATALTSGAVDSVAAATGLPSWALLAGVGLLGAFVLAEAL